MGSHTRVAPWGKTISTRVVTSNVRHLTAGRGSNGSCCACASPGSATAAGRIALAFRNARLSMSVLRSIEELSQRTRDAEYPVSVAVKRAEAGEKDLQKSEGERGSRGAADMVVGTPRSARARRLREADH